MKKAVYSIETKRVKDGCKVYSRTYTTKEKAKIRFDSLNKKKVWARLIEYYGMFPLVIEQSDVAYLELLQMLLSSYKGKLGHEKAIAACNKNIVELQEKLK
jgi:hypothetical protein